MLPPLAWVRRGTYHSRPTIPEPGCVFPSQVGRLSQPASQPAPPFDPPSPYLSFRGHLATVGKTTSPWWAGPAARALPVLHDRPPWQQRRPGSRSVRSSSTPALRGTLASTQVREREIPFRSPHTRTLKTFPPHPPPTAVPCGVVSSPLCIPADRRRGGIGPGVQCQGGTLLCGAR